MRSLRHGEIRDACFTQPEVEAGRPQNDDISLAAVSAGASFWDHLGATRAAEYAQDEILPETLLPEPPRQIDKSNLAATRQLSMGDMSAVHGFSLTESLNVSPDPELGAEEEEVILPQHTGVTSASGLALNPAYLDASAPFVSGLHSDRGRTARPRLRRGSGRLAYRLQRIWLTPGYRFAFKYVLPVVLILGAIGALLSDETRRVAITAHYDAVRDAIIDRPEFLVTELQLPEMSPELDYTLRQKLELDLPQSSFRLDLDALRAEIETLDWVRTADLRLLSGGTLALSVTERVPAILWRSDAGLELLDIEGVRVAFVTQRDVRPDLALVAGAGANAHIPQALELLEAAAPLGDRVRGLVRMGERRWDVVLDRDQRIRLPEAGPVAALERVIALDQAQDLLARDVLVADLRIPARPVLQINAGAMDTLREIRSQSLEALQ